MVESMAQTPASRIDAEFEVASVKPNKSGSRRSGSSMPPIGVYRAENLTLRQLIIDAFQVRPFQIRSGPDWLDSEHFDVQARTSDGAARDRMPFMLQALLVERFALTVRRETREQPVYALVFDREDRRPGPALKRAECSGDQCGMNTSTSNGAGVMLGTGQSMASLARWASDMVDRIVIDRTVTMDTYDFELRFTRGDASTTGAPLSADSPLIFTALREQLGLKLESARGPVESLVIERAEKPTPD